MQNMNGTVSATGDLEASFLACRGLFVFFEPVDELVSCFGRLVLFGFSISLILIVGVSFLLLSFFFCVTDG